MSMQMIKLTMLILIFLLFLLFYFHSASSVEVSSEQEVGSVTGAPLPRYVSVKNDKANMRNGPSTRYPVVWQYTQKGYPLKVIKEYDTWRQVQDIDGHEGWLHVSLLSKRNNVLIYNINTEKLKSQAANNQSIYRKLPKDQILVLRKPKPDSYPLARVKLGSVAHLERCDANGWCKISLGKLKGWVPVDSLWGVQVS